MNQNSEHKWRFLEQIDPTVETAHQAKRPNGPNDLASHATAFRVVLLCFFLSGATGLIYELLWVRMLGLVFGNSVYAITTAVCAFMAGLALGGYFFGRWIDRKPYPLMAYALLEVLVGGTALAVPLFLRGFEALYAHVYPRLSDSLWSLNSYRFASAFLALLVPTFFMGGTLPILSRFFVRSREEISKRVGWLYAVNTLGATLGTMLAGFYLISHLGIRYSLWLTVAMNLLIGLVALEVHKRVIATGDRESLTAEEEGSGESQDRQTKFAEAELVQQRADHRSPSHPWLLLAGFMFSGFASLLYEIAWTRQLTLVIGSSVYAFSLILTVFLVGIALGSFLFSKFFPAHKIRVALFGWVELAIAGLAFLMVPLYLKSIPLMLMLRRALPHDFASLVFVQLVVCFLLLLLPTLMFGTTLPLVARLYTGKVVGLGRSLGSLYSANTVGCIGGSFLTGFVLLPFLTARRTVLLGVFINVAIGVSVLLADSWKRHRIALLGSATFAVCVIVVFAGGMFSNPLLQDAGVFIYAQDLSQKDSLPLENQLRTDDLVFYREGLNANISVHVAENYVGLRTNGKTDASTAGDMVTQLLLGYLPAVFHPNPQRAFIVGFGSGSTAAAVAQLPTVESLEVAEIEKSVLEAAPYFGEVNHRVDHDPRMHLVIDDARNYLLNTSYRYDVIISEPSNPWIAGIGNLYTQEFYRAAAARLNPDGVMCQWVQIYQLDPESLKMVLRTFGDSFPYMSLWRATAGDLLLLGAQKPITFDLSRLRKWMNTIPTLRSDFVRYLNVREPAGIFAYFLLPDADLREFSKDSPLNTDDLPLLEFEAPKSMFAGTVALNTNLLEQKRTSVLPPHIAQFHDPADFLPMAETFLDRERLDWAASLLAKLSPDPAEPGTARRRSSDAVSKMSSGRVALASARLADLQKQPQEAERLYQEAMRISPADPNIKEAYGVSLYRRTRYAEAQSLLEAALKLNPNSERALFYRAESESAQGKYDEAIRHTTEYASQLARRDKKYQAFANLGELYERKGNRQDAELWFKRALELDRYAFVAHRRLAEIYYTQHRKAEAIHEYEVLVRYFPMRDELVFHNLSHLYSESGKLNEAKDVLTLGRFVFPSSVNLYQDYRVICGHKTS
jgi:spermidine synthase